MQVGLVVYKIQRCLQGGTGRRSVGVAGRFSLLLAPCTGGIDSCLCCPAALNQGRTNRTQSGTEVSGALSSGGCPFFSAPGSRCCVCGWGKVGVGLPTFLHIFSSMIQILIMNWVFNGFLKSKSLGLTIKMPSNINTDYYIASLYEDFVEFYGLPR